AGERRVRHLRFSGPADRPRRALAPHHVLAALARLAREDRADRDQRAPASDSHARTLLEARAGRAPRRAPVSRGTESGHRRHRGHHVPRARRSEIVDARRPRVCHSERNEESAFPVNPQLKGTEKLEGTYLFDLATSAKALRLNRFLHGFTVPSNRALFKDNPEAAFDRAGLTAEERRMVDR